jgi:hypothetical protein
MGGPAKSSNGKNAFSDGSPRRSHCRSSFVYLVVRRIAPPVGPIVTVEEFDRLVQVP